VSFGNRFIVSVLCLKLLITERRDETGQRNLNGIMVPFQVTSQMQVVELVRLRRLYITSI
jgi:hypothetical protein